MSSKRPFSVYYRAMKDGEVWCESKDPEQVRDAGGDELLKLETFLVSEGRQPRDGKDDHGEH